MDDSRGAKDWDERAAAAARLAVLRPLRAEQFRALDEELGLPPAGKWEADADRERGREGRGW